MFGHKHEWKYMYNSADDEYNWFYCSICMAQCAAKINDSGNVEIKTFEQWQKKKK